MVNFSLRYCSCFDHVWEQDFSTFDWVRVGGGGGGGEVGLRLIQCTSWTAFVIFSNTP